MLMCLCSGFCLFFFFQAEDGIRDHCVTGVQTCALPILLELPGVELPNRLCRELMARSSQGSLLACLRVLAGVVEGLGQLEVPKRLRRVPGYHFTQSIRRKFILRSEERRVGKGWMTRRSS